MNVPLYDVAISGAGPVGSALALALARKTPRPERIVLLGARFVPDLNHDQAPASIPDPRTLALNHGSRVLLEQFGAWPADSADILTVHVSQHRRLGRTLIEHTELGVPRLGSVTGYDALLAALHRALADSGVTLIETRPGPPLLAADHVTLAFHDRILHSRLAVQSDGARPRGVHRHYNQHAVLATVRASKPANGWAYERFTRRGPLALLPHPHERGAYALVWCSPPATAAQLQALSDPDFAQALLDTFGTRLGSFQCVGDRHIFPLSMQAGPSVINGRYATIGNAAQTLHPVAGQGLNLGLRDAAQLAQTLAPWLLQPHTDPQPSLARYAAQRRPDRWLTVAVTDFLPRVFATGNPALEHAGGLALLGMDLLPPLRRSLAGHLLRGLRR